MIPPGEFSQTPVTFQNAMGETVAGVFACPRGSGTYPVALLLHGYGNSHKAGMLRRFGVPLLQKGIACFALDAPRHGERRSAEAWPPQDPREAFVTIVCEGVREWQKALPWLLQRPEIDPARIGLLGYSMGATMGTLLAAEEPRIVAVTLCMGGDPTTEEDPILADIPRASDAIKRISPRPILFVNGIHDFVMPREAAERLHHAAGEPRTVHWVEGGHLLSRENSLLATDWLSEHLKRKEYPK